MTTNHSNGASVNPEIADYVACFIAPVQGQPVSRKAWGIDVTTVWVPYFTAAKAVGKLEIPDDALGAPLRVARDKQTGQVKFGSNGRPTYRVAPELNQAVNLARENYIARLREATAMVRTTQPDAYRAQLARNMEAGRPIIETDQADVDAAMVAMAAEAGDEPEQQTPATEQPEVATPPTEQADTPTPPAEEPAEPAATGRRKREAA